MADNVVFNFCQNVVGRIKVAVKSTSGIAGALGNVGNGDVLYLVVLVNLEKCLFQCHMGSFRLLSLFFHILVLKSLQEGLGSLFLRIIYYVAGFSLFHNKAVVHENYSVGNIASKGHFMGYHYHCHFFCGKGFYHLQDALG